jgi:hypothetical protein
MQREKVKKILKLIAVELREESVNWVRNFWDDVMRRRVEDATGGLNCS